MNINKKCIIVQICMYRLRPRDDNTPAYDPFMQQYAVIEKCNFRPWTYIFITNSSLCYMMPHTEPSVGMCTHMGITSNKRRTYGGARLNSHSVCSTYLQFLLIVCGSRKIREKGARRTWDTWTKYKSSSIFFFFKKKRKERRKGRTFYRDKSKKPTFEAMDGVNLLAPD